MKRILLVLICLFAISLTAQAEPLIISLEELRDKAPNIVFATFKGAVDGSTDLWSAPAYNLEVLQVVKGNLQLGMLQVKVGTGHATLQPGQQVICFLTNDLEFSWYAAPLGLNRDPKQDVWKIDGFYDFNAYIVTTSELTLPMMRAFFLDRAYLPYTIDGPICFFDPRTRGLKPSTYTIHLAVGKGKTAQFQTNLTLNDFAKQNWAEAVGNCWGTTPFLRLQSAVTGRTMEINSEIVGTDPETGAMRCRFWVSNPTMYAEQTLLTFLADAKIYNPWYEITVKTSKGETWAVAMHQESGQTGTLSGTPWGTLELAEISDEPITFITVWSGEERLAIITDRIRDDKLGLRGGGTEGSIVQNLMMAPMSAKVYLDQQGKPEYLGPATLTLKEVHYRR
jgi:hypothetical protein